MQRKQTCRGCEKTLKCANCGETVPTVSSAQARIYSLKHLHGMSEKEIAALEGITQQSVNGLSQRLYKSFPYLAEPYNQAPKDKGDLSTWSYIIGGLGDMTMEKLPFHQQGKTSVSKAVKPYRQPPSREMGRQQDELASQGTDCFNGEPLDEVNRQYYIDQAIEQLQEMDIYRLDRVVQNLVFLADYERKPRKKG